jgi:uncharacterized membrane protein YgcG
MASGSLQEEDFVILLVVFFVCLFIGLFAIPILMTAFSGAAAHSVIRAAMTLIFLAIAASLGMSFLGAVVPGGLGQVVPAVERIVECYPFPFLLAGSFALLNGVFVYLMKAPTALGRPVMDQLEGFRMYLETAEKDRLNMQAPELTTERFEALLPYAVALDVEKPWSEAFAAALQRAHPNDPDPLGNYHPGWHTGSGWSSSTFANSVSSTVAATSSALAAAIPASSGSSGFSSGGGGSGGGGGGGGGGGW